MFQCFLGFHPNMISASEKLPPISESPCQHSENQPCGTALCSSFRPAPLSESCICRTAPCSSFPPAHHSETWPCGTAHCSSFHPVSLSESWLCRTASCSSFPLAHLSERWPRGFSSLHQLPSNFHLWNLALEGQLTARASLTAKTKQNTHDTQKLHGSILNFPQISVFTRPTNCVPVREA